MRRFLCRIGLHVWDYSGNAHTHAPRPIRCERCGIEYGTKREIRRDER